MRVGNMTLTESAARNPATRHVLFAICYCHLLFAIRGGNPMCGIVGYIGPRNAAQIILDGLRRLEYRGYDSAGIAVIQDGSIAIRRDVGKLSNLSNRLVESPIEGNIGIGHTRWATHGKPSERNAHPHTDFSGQLVVVHNGIVENFRELRAELEAEGHRVPVGHRYRGDRAPGGAPLHGRADAGRGGVARRCANCAVPAPSSSCHTGSRACWWPRDWATPVACRSASARVRCSSPPICRPSWNTPGGWSSWKTARWPS